MKYILRFFVTGEETSIGGIVYEEGVVPIIPRKGETVYIDELKYNAENPRMYNGEVCQYYGETDFDFFSVKEVIYNYGKKEVVVDITLYGEYYEWDD